MAEQLICNQQVVGSTPTTSSKRGKIPEWPKGADCKSVGTAFGGSNPPLPTKKKTSQCGVFFYAGNRGFCAVYTARRVAPEPPVSVLTLRYKISQGVPSGRLPRYARNDIKCVARNSIKRVCKVCYYFFSKQTLITFRTKYSVIARSVATWQSPGRESYEKTALSDGFLIFVVVLITLRSRRF